MEIRIDKWLWAVRIYKTRTIALEECNKNRITVNGVVAKPSRTIKAGDIINVRKPPVTFIFRVLELTASRVGAKLVPEFLENITPQEQYEILKMQQISGFIDREKGTGRPTKKERRDLDDFLEF
ncbi:MAG: RNA-binding S4 domain-containing protein [Dysgonamonadaceae bacterium]|jgi:ribosome-associated heat shock protein Hsp15|nr:RNA-binding S4 domain-containing protein [Dysgonamonadaceae bacterium]